jgi:hypothetical protein
VYQRGVSNNVLNLQPISRLEGAVIGDKYAKQKPIDTATIELLEPDKACGTLKWPIPIDYHAFPNVARCFVGKDVGMGCVPGRLYREGKRKRPPPGERSRPT